MLAQICTRFSDLTNDFHELLNTPVKILADQAAVGRFIECLRSVCTSQATLVQEFRSAMEKGSCRVQGELESASTSNLSMNGPLQLDEVKSKYILQRRSTTAARVKASEADISVFPFRLFPSFVTTPTQIQPQASVGVRC